MTTRFVRSSAAGAADGTSWTNAYTTLSAAASAAAAGDTVFVADDHAETGTSSNTITFSSSGAPVLVMCADRTVSSPGSSDLKTTGTVSTTSTGLITLLGRAYIYGLTFSNGSGASNTSFQIGAASSNQYFRFENCVLKQNTTLSGSSIRIGATSSGNGNRIELINTNVVFSSTGQYIRMDGLFFTWRGGSAAATGSVPTTLFNTISTLAGVAVVDGVDLSAISGTLVATETVPRQFVFRNCKTNASVTFLSTPASYYSSWVDHSGCDSSSGVYKHGRVRYEGTQTVDTTVYRAGGASDGTTPISTKIVTGSAASYAAPFESLLLVVPNAVTGSSVTVTVYGTASALPTSAELWIRASSLSTSGSALPTFTSSGVSNPLDTGSSLSTDSSTSTNGSTSTFKMSVSVTPQVAGPISVAVVAAKASTTYWIDPKIVLS